MLQRIRKCFGIENNHFWDNEVEVDETFVGGKKKKENKTNKEKVIESFNGATKGQKEKFVNALEQALNSNPKKKKRSLVINI